jgi:hypothetical protein
MELFSRMASRAAADLLGSSADERISNADLARQLEQMALDDPELAAHYARMAAALPAFQVQRAQEDLEMEAGEDASAANPGPSGATASKKPSWKRAG